MKAETVLRRPANNKTGWKKLHGPSIRSGTPSVMEFPRETVHQHRASKADCLRALADYLEDRPKLAQHVGRIKVEFPG